MLDYFEGYHSEWNLVSPRGWDYQCVTQIIGRAVWLKLNAIRPCEVQLDFNHPLFYPVNSFANILVEAHRFREGRNPGLIAIVVDKETLQDVIENRNLASCLNDMDGINSELMAPEELEIKNGRICRQNKLSIRSHFTYVLGPIKIAIRPRIIKFIQIEALKNYGVKLWLDCLTLEKLWLAGELADLIELEGEELEIAHLQPWSGTHAIIASDGLFSFGAHL